MGHGEIKSASEILFYLCLKGTQPQWHLNQTRLKCRLSALFQGVNRNITITVEELQQLVNLPPISSRSKVIERLTIK